MNKGILLCILVILSLIFVFDSNAQMLTAKSISKEQENDKPSLNVLRISGEIGVGTVGGIFGAALPIVLLSSDSGEDWGGLFAVVFLAPITYTLGSVGGVYLIGSLGDETASFPATLLGGVAGGVVAMVIWSRSVDYSSSRNRLAKIGTWIGVVAAPIGATIAFNLTRKYEKSSASAAPPMSFSMNLMKMAF